MGSKCVKEKVGVASKNKNPTTLKVPNTQGLRRGRKYYLDIGDLEEDSGYLEMFAHVGKIFIAQTIVVKQVRVSQAAMSSQLKKNWVPPY